MTKHTPGPWRTEQAFNSAQVHIVAAVDGLERSIATDIWCDGDEQEANVNLIVAAPDLLEALEMIVAEADSYTARTGKPVYNWLDQARAAIAKARGEA
jgi:hypothetical protein